MTLKKIKSWIKNLYSTGSKSELQERYEYMSNLELASLLGTEGLRLEAFELAKQLLIKRLNLNHDFTPSEVFDAELNRLIILSKRCHLCGEGEPSQKHFFCVRNLAKK